MNKVNFISVFLLILILLTLLFNTYQNYNYNQSLKQQSDSIYYCINLLGRFSLILHERADSIEAKLYRMSPHDKLIFNPIIPIGEWTLLKHMSERFERYNKIKFP